MVARIASIRETVEMGHIEIDVAHVVVVVIIVVESVARVLEWISIGVMMRLLVLMRVGRESIGKIRNNKLVLLRAALRLITLV